MGTGGIGVLSSEGEGEKNMVRQRLIGTSLMTSLQILNKTKGLWPTWMCSTPPVGPQG